MAKESEEAIGYRGLNRLLLAGHAGGALLAYLGLPLLMRGLDASWPAWLLLPLALSANGYWAVLHEAIHGHLLARPADNRRAGRLLAILWGSSFRFLRFGHLSHHRFNRHPLDRPDWFDPRTTSPFRARLRFYFELLGGLYLLEVLTPLLFLQRRAGIAAILLSLFRGETPPLPSLRALALQGLASAKALAEIRRDALLALGLLAAAFLLWGAAWPAFAAFLLGRGLLVSFIDNVYHYGTPIERPDFAYNLRLPRPLQALILNMNLHRQHHREVNVPWWGLPARLAASVEGFDAALFPQAMAQLRGPAPIRPAPG